MNLWGKKTFGLAVCTLLALFMSSCKEESPIGTELEPNKNNVGVALVEIPVLYDNVKLDSILSADLRFSDQATTLSRILLGKVQDPNVGSINLETYITFQISEGNRALIPARDSASTSLDLRMVVTDAVGDLSQSQTFDIYELASEMELNRNYYTSDSEILFPVDEPIASFTLSDLDTVDFVDGEVQQVSVALNKDLERRLFDLAVDTTTTIFVSNNFLRESFKGIIIKPREDNSATLNLDRNLITLTLNYYYLDDNVDEDGNVVQTDTVDLATLLTPEKAYFNAEIDPIAPFQGISETQIVDTGDEFAYLLPQLGVYPRLNLNQLSVFRDTVSRDNVAINLAQLFVSGIENSSAFPAPPVLTLAVTLPDLDFVQTRSRVGSNESVSPLVVANESSVILSGASPVAYTTNSSIRLELSDNRNEYVGDVTTLVQQLVNRDSLAVAFSRIGEETNEIDSTYVGLDDYLLLPQSGITGGFNFIAGTDSTNSSTEVTGVYPIYNTVRNVKFDGARFKLKVYYTTID